MQHALAAAALQRLTAAAWQGWARCAQCTEKLHGCGSAVAVARRSASCALSALRPVAQLLSAEAGAATSLQLAPLLCAAQCPALTAAQPPLTWRRCGVSLACPL